MTVNAAQNAKNTYDRIMKPRSISVNHSKERKELEEQLRYYENEMKRLEAIGTKANVSSIKMVIENNINEIYEKLKMLNVHHGGKRLTFRRKLKRSKRTRGRK